jgi:signal transduction histidine kinase
MEVQKIGDNIHVVVIIATAGVLALTFGIVYFFIRYRRKLIRQHREMMQRELEYQQKLLVASIQSQEIERKRISQDLHDHVGGALSGLRYVLSGITGSGDHDPNINEVAQKARIGIDAIIDDVRNISHSLSPAGLELWGFHEALYEYSDKTSASSGVQIVVTDCTNGLLQQLGFDDALSLFRVIQELITNTLKHARASRITIVSDILDDHIALVYTDDGVGMQLPEEQQNGIGLYNIESRLSMLNASYDIVSEPGKGYSFTITIPASILTKNRKHGKN